MESQKLIFKIAQLSHGIQINNFKDYIHNVHQNFTDDAQKLKELYENTVNHIKDPDDLSYLEEMVSEQYNLLTVFQPSMYRKSTLVSLYSYLEHNLNSFCNTLHTIHNTKIKVTDIKGDGIIRAKTFLTKLYAIDFGDAHSKWDFLNDLNKIRNCIVHADSNLESVNNSNAVKDAIKKHPGLSIVDKKYVDIDETYISNCLQNIDNFFIWLYSRNYA